MTFRKLIDLESFKRDVPLLTIGELAAKYGISKASVSRLKVEVADLERNRESQPADNPEQEAAEEDSGAYDVAISIPISCLDDFLGTAGLDELRVACFDLDSQNKAQLVQSILQARVSSYLPPADVEIPVIADQGEAYAETTT